MYRGFKIRLYPTQSQKRLLEKHFGCCRWTYNWGLDQKISSHKRKEKRLSLYSIINKLPELKKQEANLWLQDVSARSLCDSLLCLDRAFENFFKHHKKFPRFKKKRDGRNSFINSSKNRLDTKLRRLIIPKFPEGIRFRASSVPMGMVKSVAVSKSASGKYIASIQIKIEKAFIQVPATEENTLGLDFGLKHLIVTSEGEKFENPKTLAKFYKRLARLQREMKRKKSGSRNKDKARKKLASLYEKITNIREGHLHRIANRLIRKPNIVMICMENLSASRMRDKRRGVKWAIQDASWRKLRQYIRYKAKNCGKLTKLIGRFEPSTQTCNCCGFLNKALTPSDREWKCECGVIHDRDINAAINVKKMALKKFVRNDEIPKDIRELTPVEQLVAVNQECLVT